MHEVISLSFSQKSNNVLTHFYNLQESLLYDGSLSGKIDNGIHLLRKRGNDRRTFNYYPRALLWDFYNGFGALSKYEYFEPKIDMKSLSEKFDSDTTLTTDDEKLGKNGYQKALDGGKATGDLADHSRMKYWSDFSKVIYRPESLMRLDRWEYSFDTQQGHLRSHPEIRFDRYDVGCDEFDEDHSAGIDAVEDNFRRILENCDTINGLNTITELDTSWAGFTNKFLTIVKDQYLPKAPIFVWSLTDDGATKSLPLVRQISRIKSLVALLNNSSLYMPVSTYPEDVLPQWVDAKSNWQISSYQVVPMELVNQLILPLESSRRVSLNEFAAGLTGDSTERNIVSDINLPKGCISCKNTFRSAKPRNTHVFGKSTIGDCKVDDTESLKEYGTSERCIRRYRQNIPFDNTLDSFPKQFREATDSFEWCSLEITDKPKDSLDEMLRIVSRYCRDDEREDLKDSLSNLKEQYEWGFEDDEEYD
ncbi:hypothetical protein FOA43_004254 [Brettanomyces nanus]|uniref:Protein DML1 n=1 Tax=Eeniella nana TaxID=13502 RepID=A0A875RQG3_EENNA|nr:uncharacterized protein FOA43_004254 [Brettanomyces nanus]QPG76860.1 hypothetical protein FOA43_004254 [Brettanomyces nanus]